jgi:hypothetical protein
MTATAGVLSHAAVGCFQAAFSGGNCGRGALAAAVAQSAAPLENRASQWGGPAAGAAAAGIVGGAAARASGGSFNDGFSVGAAGYLFNELLHEASKPKAEQIYRSPPMYPTRHAAAVAAFSYAEAQSDSGINEYGGGISFDDEEGGYYFTVYHGGPSYVTMNLAGMSASWHTHPWNLTNDPASTTNWRNQYPSDMPGGDLDVNAAAQARIPWTLSAYLRTPFMELRYFPNLNADPRSYEYLGLQQ